MINIAPDDWKGYALASRCLHEIGATNAAIRTVKAGLNYCPKNRRLLKIAWKLYDKTKNKKKAFEFKLKFALRHPTKINLQVQMIHDLIYSGKTKKLLNYSRKPFRQLLTINSFLILRKIFTILSRQARKYSIVCKHLL